MNWSVIKWIGIMLATVVPTVAYLADQRTIAECREARKALAERAIAAEKRVDSLSSETEGLRKPTLRQ